MMHLAPRDAPPAAIPSSASRQCSSRQLYFAMLRERGGSAGRIDQLTRAASRTFLSEKLREATAIEGGFPIDVLSLAGVLR